MPILKSLGVTDPKVPRAGTLPLRTSRNPFEEVPGLEEEPGEPGPLPNGTSCHRRATLEKLVGLGPFRLGWIPGRRAGSPGDGQPRSFLGRVLSPGIRRSSADFGLLARLQGTRTHGEEEAGDAARRLAFLRLGRGPKPRRASLAERVVPAGEAAPEPPPKVREPPKMKEPLSGELPLADRYALLHWHNQVYPREVLGLVDMVALENGELGPLLSPGTLRGLEDECVTDVKAQTRAALLRVLQEDEERWGNPEDQPGSLAQDVCELLEEHTERAPRISQELGERMAHCCLAGLAEFLQSFQQRVERFHENPGIRELPPDIYISRTIALVNCGPPLRALAERLARVGPLESEPAREASSCALDRVTQLCHQVLADLLFQELQPHFNKLMRRKWLSSPEALDGIVGTLGAQALALRRMQDEPYQESQASWLDSVVPHLAEVLQLEDTPSIQVEVAVLVRDYPDIRRKHVAALLDIRGLHSAAARQEILAVARDLELSEGGALPPSRDRAFFSDIPVPRRSFCLGLPLALGRLPLSRLARPSWACLPLGPQPPSPRRPRAQR
ncbi:Exocyst complex component 3-like protein 2 [Fukomys damarensis]|uniref:Exocyst complex component 3-like protein 2 n=1 Tax=Fukomys damarensis TaxID=885580 RepID=A0A091CM78_FUKDA|nr:Exocyst complex component 3-like protein 2 [Fukomys damarensis]